MLALPRAIAHRSVARRAARSTWSRDGVGTLEPRLPHQLPVRRSRQNAGIESALIGTLWLMARLRRASSSRSGVATAIYLEEYADRDALVEPPDRGQHPEPRRGARRSSTASSASRSSCAGRSSSAHVVLAGGLTLGLLVLPVVIIAAREAIRAVPPSIREGSMALGATQWQTIWQQVLPAAIPGIATGVILALSRAIGETAPLILVGAATFVAFNPTGLDSRSSPRCRSRSSTGSRSRRRSSSALAARRSSCCW